MATLHLVRGYPGSGKSSFARRAFPGVLHVENDMALIQDGEYKWSKERMPIAIAWCISMVKHALEIGMDVCVCNTFTKKRYVEAYAKIAREARAKFEVYRCTGDFKNLHGLSQSKVESFKQAMEDWPGEVLVEPVP